MEHMRGRHQPPRRRPPRTMKMEIWELSFWPFGGPAWERPQSHPGTLRIGIACSHIVLYVTRKGTTVQLAREVRAPRLSHIICTTAQVGPRGRSYTG